MTLRQEIIIALYFIQEWFNVVMTRVVQRFSDVAGLVIDVGGDDSRFEKVGEGERCKVNFCNHL